MARQQPASAAGCSHGSSLHSQPAAPAQHDSAALRLEGLRLRSHAFAIPAPACIRTQLHLAHPCKRRTPALKGFVTAAVLRFSWLGNSPHSQPVASSAASLHSHAAASRSSLQAMHTSPVGLRCRCSASLARARQLAAFASGCFRGAATACVRSRLLPVQQSASASSCLPAQHESAALRPPGSICAALLSLAWRET